MRLSTHPLYPFTRILWPTAIVLPRALVNGYIPAVLAAFGLLAIYRVVGFRGVLRRAEQDAVERYLIGRYDWRLLSTDRTEIEVAVGYRFDLPPYVPSLSLPLRTLAPRWAALAFEVHRALVREHTRLRFSSSLLSFWTATHPEVAIGEPGLRTSLRLCLWAYRNPGALATYDLGGHHALLAVYRAAFPIGSPYTPIE